MTFIGFDYHKKWTQAAAIDDQGKIIREMRVLNDSSSLKGFLKGLPKPLKGVVEAGPTWGWIIPATVFFADLRGYTNLSQGTDSAEVVGMLHEFYDECAAAVWGRDGIVNKFIGDAVLAIFNFPIMREDHVRQAVLAAIELQRSMDRWQIFSQWQKAVHTH
jgi:hypothetical protein